MDDRTMQVVWEDEGFRVVSRVTELDRHVRRDPDYLDGAVVAEESFSDAMGCTGWFRLEGRNETVMLKAALMHLTAKRKG